MQNELAKYRNMTLDGNTPAIELLVKYQLLIKDGKKGELDPFLHKVNVQGKK
jgi:hypothetical protein